MKNYILNLPDETGLKIISKATGKPVHKLREELTQLYITKTEKRYVFNYLVIKDTDYLIKEVSLNNFDSSVTLDDTFFEHDYSKGIFYGYAKPFYKKTLEEKINKNLRAYLRKTNKSYANDCKEFDNKNDIQPEC